MGRTKKQARFVFFILTVRSHPADRSHWLETLCPTPRGISGVQDVPSYPSQLTFFRSWVRVEKKLAKHYIRLWVNEGVFCLKQTFLVLLQRENGTKRHFFFCNKTKNCRLWAVSIQPQTEGIRTNFNINLNSNSLQFTCTNLRVKEYSSGIGKSTYHALF